jgi:galactokinase
MNTAHLDMAGSVVDAFRSTFGDDDDVIVAMAPGRVNLIGEYTDLNDGFVFPMTVDRGVYFAIRARSDTTVRVASVRYDELIEYQLNEFEAPRPGSWSSYVLGVVEELRLRGLLERGFEAVVDGNLNLGAGLSSSAALEVATGVSLQQVFDFDMDRVDMVKLCQHVEHNYAKVLCGIMDQFASGIGREGHALLLDCRSLDHENVPVELGEHRVVIISSEVQRSLASSAYNTRRAECQAGVGHFARYDDSVRALRDVSAELFEAHSDKLTPVIRRRCRHVISENQRALDGAAALKAGQLDRFGELMNASHRSLRDDFEVSCPELDMLVTLANGTGGVLGSRMTGAGFGGCTVSIVHKDSVASLVGNLIEYRARFNLTPGVFVLEGNLEAGPMHNTA